MSEPKYILSPPNDVKPLRFRCQECGWLGEPFIPQHSIFDTVGCPACEPPEDGTMPFDPKRVINGCPGCNIKQEQ